MGVIEVHTRGSFGTRMITDTAEVGGHAAALSRVIGQLVAMLPEAIIQDHRLHDQGEKPPLSPFGEHRTIVPDDSGGN